MEERNRARRGRKNILKAIVVRDFIFKLKFIKNCLTAALRSDQLGTLSVSPDPLQQWTWPRNVAVLGQIWEHSLRFLSRS